MEGGGGGQQMEKTHSLYSFIFTEDLGSMFPQETQPEGRVPSLSSSLSSHISCCAVTRQNTQSGPMSD